MKRSALCITLLFACMALYAQKGPVHFRNPAALATASTYSHIAEIDLGTVRMIILSGQVPLDEKGNLVGGNDLAAQAEQVYKNIGIALKEVGANFSHVVKTGIYLTDMSQVDAFRKVRNKYINLQQPPASTLVQVQALYRPDVLVEIELTAIVRKTP